MATAEWGTKQGAAQPVSAPSETRRDSEALRSEEYVVKAMPPILGKRDMVAIYLLIIFFVTNATTAVGGGAAAFTYLILGAVTFFIPCAIATAQLGVMFPHEGSLYNWTHKALGGYWSFFVAFCAWFPGVLVMIICGAAIVTFLQGMNGSWLTEAWQQGLVIISVIVASGIIAVQRFRTVQYMINVVAILTFVGVAIIGLAGVVWLATGHHSQTDFSTLSNWSIHWDFSSGNIYLFGLVTLAYLGIETPMNMGGELRAGPGGEGSKRKIITGHLLWGTLLVLVGYLIATFSVLVVEGASKGSSTTYALVFTVIDSLGKIPGAITAVCIMSFFIMAAVTYNIAYARLLLVAGIDQRLPANVGRLNQYRVPANAIFFQTVVAAAITSAMYFAIPYVVRLGITPESLSIEVYNIVLAASTLVWAFSTMFLFVNLVRFFRRDARLFKLQLIFPQPLLWVCIVLGSASCIAAIIGTLVFSWIPSLIDNGHWWYIIGGLTVVCLIIAAVGSMLASSEAAWQELSRDQR